MEEVQIQLEAKLFKGFADRSRLSILGVILGGPKSVTEIAEETKLSQPNTSAHLACLSECGLIKKKRKGREIFYEVTDRDVSCIIRSAQKILKKNAKAIYGCSHY